MQAGLTPGARQPRQPTPSSPAHPPPHQRLMPARSAPQTGPLRPEGGTRAMWWLALLFLQRLKLPQKGSGRLHRGASLHGQSPLQCSR